MSFVYLSVDLSIIYIMEKCKEHFHHLFFFSQQNLLHFHFHIKTINFYFHIDLFRIPFGINETKVEEEIHFFLPWNHRRAKCGVFRSHTFVYHRNDDNEILARFLTDNKFFFTQLNLVVIEQVKENNHWNIVIIATFLSCLLTLKIRISSHFDTGKWTDLMRIFKPYHALQTSDFCFSYWDKFRCDQTQWSSFHRTKMQISTKYRFHFNQQEEKSAPSCTWPQFHWTKSHWQREFLCNNMKFILLQWNTTDKILLLLLHCYFRQRKIIWLSKRILWFFDTQCEHCRWISHRIKCFSLFNFSNG